MYSVTVIGYIRVGNLVISEGLVIPDFVGSNLILWIFQWVFGISNCVQQHNNATYKVKNGDLDQISLHCVATIGVSGRIQWE